MIGDITPFHYCAVLGLTTQDVELLRSSVLEMRSSFPRLQEPTIDDARRQNCEPMTRRHSNETRSESASEEIPEDIQDQSTSQDACSHGQVKADTTVRRRVTRPLSSNQGSSPTSAAPRILDCKKPVWAAAPEPALPRGKGPSTDEHSSAAAAKTQHTVAAVMQLDSGPRAAAHAVAGLGDGDGIMQRLSQQTLSMDGKSAEVLTSIVQTLSQAKNEGVNLTALFESLIHSATRSGIDATAVVASPRTLTDCTTKKVAMRLPRGLLPDVLSKGASQEHTNEVILRLLGSHDDRSSVVRLQRIELLDQDSKRCVSPFSRVC